jgi:hypothetical protein
VAFRLLGHMNLQLFFMLMMNMSFILRLYQLFSVRYLKRIQCEKLKSNSVRDTLKEFSERYLTGIQCEILNRF